MAEPSEASDTCIGTAVSYAHAWEEMLQNPSSPYQQWAILCAFYVLLTFVVSTVTGNYSQVDKLWSVVPFLYTWLTVIDARTRLMAILATIWGIRLTYNFARRGGYQWPPWEGDEDYRWAVIRKGGFVAILKEPIPWVLFNFGFVSLYQNILLLLIATPSLIAYTVAKECPASSARELNRIDYAAAAAFMFFVVIETIADNQQYAFQTEKYRRKNAGTSDRGICRRLSSIGFVCDCAQTQLRCRASHLDLLLSFQCCGNTCPDELECHWLFVVGAVVSIVGVVHRKDYPREISASLQTLHGPGSTLCS